MAAGDVDPSRLDRDWILWRGGYEDEFVSFRERVPYRYLERVAIMHHEGKLPLYRARELAALALASESDLWEGKPTVDEVEQPRCTDRLGGSRCEGRASIRRNMFDGKHVCADCAARRLGHRCPRCRRALRENAARVEHGLGAAMAVSATRDGRTFCDSCVDWIESRS